ncbi:MAG: Verru_Chthon cassette protein D [Fimbriimonadaceae bacterium]
MKNSLPSNSGGHAFSLIEMLVVVTIIVLLLAFSTPALMRTMQSTRLTSVGDTMFGVISQAQQTAFAQNAPVELRFFKHGDEGFSDAPEFFRSYQLFKIELLTTGTGATATVKESIVPVGNLVKFSDGIVIATDNELSPALSGEGLPDSKGGDSSSAGYSGVEGATYNALRFLTDGSCHKVGTNATVSGATQATLTFQTLPTSFFTITYDINKEITTSNLPNNFYTIQVDPYTGKARSYKPGF